MLLGLGDLLASALKIVGITEERVSRWIGGPCGCKERQDKLNSLTTWARRVISGKRENAVEYLDQLTNNLSKEPKP
jgi:hypothetical protein